MNESEKYLAYVNEQHAPNDLVEKTKLLMKLEKEKLDTEKRNKQRKIAVIKRIAVAAAICGIVGLGYIRITMNMQSQFQFSQIEAVEETNNFYLGTFQKESRRVTLNEYNTYTGNHYTTNSVMDNYQCIWQENHVTFKSLKEIEKGNAAFIFSKDYKENLEYNDFQSIEGSAFYLQCGFQEELLPNSLANVIENEYEGIPVRLGKEEGREFYIAYFKIDSNTYLLEAKNMKERTFLKLLKDVIAEVRTRES